MLCYSRIRTRGLRCIRRGQALLTVCSILAGCICKAAWKALSFDLFGVRRARVRPTTLFVLSSDIASLHGERTRRREAQKVKYEPPWLAAWAVSEAHALGHGASGLHPGVLWVVAGKHVAFVWPHHHP